jgi:DNA-binding response OmpR family regulator
MRPPVKDFIGTVVVCSPEEPLLEAISERLAEDGYAPLPAANASAASRLCRFTRPDLLIVDLGLPDGTGLALLRERTRDPDFPALGALALAGAEDSVAMLREDPELALDDYLRRPFDLDELRVRLQGILHRRGGGDERVVRLGELVIDPPRRKVTVGGAEVHLSKKEFLLLRVLASDPTRVFPKDELLRAVWGLRYPAGRTRTLDSHASRLRRKLDPEHRRFVVNSWGIGYRLLDSLDDAEPVSGAGGEAR